MIAFSKAVHPAVAYATEAAHLTKDIAGIAIMGEQMVEKDSWTTGDASIGKAGTFRIDFSDVDVFRPSAIVSSGSVGSAHSPRSVCRSCAAVASLLRSTSLCSPVRKFFIVPWQKRSRTGV